MRAPYHHVEPLCHNGSSLHRDPGGDLAPRFGRTPAPADPAVVPVNATNPLPPEGAVPSGPPGVLDTPDGWKLKVVGSNETQLPVAPLTTAISSREYLVAGTFTGKITGGGKTKLTGGSIEAGEQIGCGISPTKPRSTPASASTGHRHAVHRAVHLRRQPAGQDVPQARHRDHGCDRQEVVQGHLDPHHHHRGPHQDRPVRRSVFTVRTPR